VTGSHHLAMYPHMKEEDLVAAFTMLIHETSKIHHNLDFAYQKTAIELDAKMFQQADAPLYTMLAAAAVLECGDITAHVDLDFNDDDDVAF